MQQVMRWTRVIVALALVAMAAPAIVAQESGKLKVTVDYKGTGRSTRRTRFSSGSSTRRTSARTRCPSPMMSSPPTAPRSNFSGLPKEVYLAAAYDEKGDYDGTSGPPPSGTPITIYGEMGVRQGDPDRRRRRGRDRDV